MNPTSPGGPRVEMHYAVSLGGKERRVELPFVIGVMADLSGAPEKPLPLVSERQFRNIDLQNFDAVMQSAAPRLALKVPNILTGRGDLRVVLSFAGVDDFSPWAVARRVPALQTLLGRRGDLVKQAALGEVASDLRPILEKAMARNYSLPRVSREFAGRIARKASLELVAEIDRMVANQVNAILHQPDFQALEATWLGLHFLVSRARPGRHLRVMVMNTTREELGNQLERFSAESGPTAWYESPLFRRVYSEQFDMPGGSPLGLMVGDYAFDHSPASVSLLTRLARIAAACHAPFLGEVAPAALGRTTWNRLERMPLDRLLEASDYAAWRALRDDVDANYVVLTLPRFLIRQPWSAKAKEATGFDFVEDTQEGAAQCHVWANSAYAMAANAARAFNDHGWWGRLWGLQGGGIVEDLLPHQFQTAAGLDCTRWPVEVLASDETAGELEVHLGVNVLQYNKLLKCGVFPSAHSLARLQNHSTDGDEWVRAGHFRRLDYLLPICRCVQFVKAIVRDNHGHFKEREQIERCLIEWIAGYVLTDQNASDELKARFPLATAEIKVEEVSGSPGHYHVHLRCRPHFQVEELTEPLNLSTTVRCQAPS